MKSANLIRFRTVALIIGLCCTALAMSAQTVVPAGQPGANRVHLITGTDPQFDSLVQQRLPQIAASPRYQAIKGTSVVVINDTPFKVKAAVLKWSITQPDGTQSVSFSCICPQPSGRVILPGRVSALLPSHIALVSPLGHASEGIGTGHQASTSVLDAAYVNASSAPAVLGARQLTVAIDGIVFDNDSVIGPDTFGLLDKFACARNGAIAEGQALAPLANDSAALTQQLNTDAALSNNSSGACVLGRASEARRLLDLQQSRGSKAVTAAIKQLAGARVITLRRGR